MECGKMSDNNQQSPDDILITIEDACEIVGGTKPIDPATFYRGVKAGRFPKPVHPMPGISRIWKSRLLAVLPRHD